jgi:hypothetical protein
LLHIEGSIWGATEDSPVFLFFGINLELPGIVLYHTEAKRQISFVEEFWIAVEKVMDFSVYF